MPKLIWPARLALALGACFLAACSGSATLPTPTAAVVAEPTAVSVNVATQAPLSTEAPLVTQPALATEAPAATEPAIATEAAPTSALVEPTAVPLAEGVGQIVLQLGVGTGDGQVGVANEGPNLVSPRSFRIGADGSIRVLDDLNKRILFFDQKGAFVRAFAIAAVQSPQDFIVNNAGEIFVFDRGSAQVFRYSPQGEVTATIPLSTGVSTSADGIMLTASQDLLLVQNNQSFWILVHNGATVPPELQPLTMRTGTATPRSPMIFQTTLDQNQAPFLHVVGLRGGPTGDLVTDVDGRPISLPADVQFFNVDRAMNLYFTRSVPDAEAVDVWRVNPDGTPVGGVHIPTGSCGTSWRSLYVDQGGVAWTMCSNESGLKVTRYPLLAADGAPLPEPAKEAADVAWKPGARLDAA